MDLPEPEIHFRNLIPRGMKVLDLIEHVLRDRLIALVISRQRVVKGCIFAITVVMIIGDQWLKAFHSEIILARRKKFFCICVLPGVINLSKRSRSDKQSEKANEKRFHI